MNEKNFDSLKNIRTPQAWLDKASAIPETAVKKNAFPPLYRYVTAASIVLVSVIGLLVFLFFGNGKTPVTVQGGNPAATDSRSEETTVGETANGAPQTDAAVSAETIAVLSTDAQGNTVVTYRDNPTPTASETNTRPTQSALSPTASSSSASPIAPNATENVAPPTELPAPTAASATELQPTQPYRPPATQEATEANEPPGDCEIYGMFRLNTASGSGYVVEEEISVFCRLYDSSGSLAGDSPLYSPQREATILSRYDNGTVVVYYNPAANGLYLTEDAYEYVFYDVHGNELCRDVKYVF